MRVTLMMTVVLLGVSSARGQDDVPSDISIFGWEAPQIVEPYYPDRATVTPSASTVPVGRFVIGAGATYTFDDEMDTEVQNWTGPELLIRGGIIPRVEGRLFWEGYSSTEIDSDLFSDTISGTTDLSAGVKVSLLDQMSFLPAAAVLGEISLPVGSDELTSDRVDPSVQLTLWYDEVAEVWSIFGSGKLSFLEDSTGSDFTQVQASAGVAYDWDEATRTFVEYFAFFTDQDGSEDAHFLQGGVIYDVAPNVTVDARIGFGLTEESADLFVGFGGSISL